MDELKASKAFLATEMNGESLTRDHGAPVRLVVPGWYGCVCIKWVDEVTLLGEGAATTSQMREFASRTMQQGVPELVKDYRPAFIEQAAMPIRVEKWVGRPKNQIPRAWHRMGWFPAAEWPGDTVQFRVQYRRGFRPGR